jgi:ribosomal-protein-alanine N-acetyltransferase
MAVRFTLLGASEVTAIMPVMTTAFDPDYSEAWGGQQVVAALALPSTLLIGCWRDDAVIGFALIRTLFDECELLLVALAKDVQHQGFGQSLLAQVIKYARGQGASRLFLEVRVNNPAVRFYERQNFRPIGMRPNYYRKRDGKLIDAQTMVIDIN